MGSGRVTARLVSCPSRFFVAIATVVFACCFSAQALAWVSLVVKADNVEVQVERDGSALVTHQLLLRLRGGPLKSLTINGVDEDAEMVQEATITRAISGRAAGPPILLVPERDGQLLHLELSTKKGVRTGSYLVSFTYRTELLGRGLIHAVDGHAELSWTGPLFTEGIDSLQTTFVLPRAETPPHLADSVIGESSAIVATGEGVFLGELQRTAEFDRLQLSRPHVPKNERVTWKARVDAELFRNLEAPVSVVMSRGEEADAEVAQPAATRAASWVSVLAIALTSLVVTLFVALKRRLAKTTFVLPTKLRVHYLALFVSLSASFWFAMVTESATLAGVSLLMAMLLMLQQSRRPLVEPKGPGRWRSVDLDELELPSVQGAPRGLWLDASGVKGLSLFLVLLVGFAVVGLRLIGSSPYHSAMTLVYSTVLVPLFFTVGSLNHRSLLEEQQSFLVKLTKRLGRRRHLSVVACGRYARDAELPDELRVRLQWEGVIPGLNSFEVGLGFLDTTLKRLLVPAIVVRVREGSPAHLALPRDAHWSRGRDVDERVAVIRPALPLLTSCVETIVGLVERLNEKYQSKERRGRQRSGSPNSAKRSSGRPRSTTKLGTSSLPAQAMR